MNADEQPTRQYVDLFGTRIWPEWNRRPIREMEGETCEVCGAVTHVAANGNSASQVHARDCNDRKDALVARERAEIKTTTRRVLMRTRARWAAR